MMEKKKGLIPSKQLATSKCAICHLVLVVSKLKTVWLSGSFQVHVCRSKCLTPTTKKDFDKYLGPPVETVDMT